MNIYKLKKFDIKRIQMNSQSGFLLRFFSSFLHTSMFVLFHTIPGKMVEKIKKINSTFSGAIRSCALNFLRPAFSIFFLRSSFLLLTSYFLITCSTPTSADKTVTFSGTVTLQGATDFSGVSVSLYKPVELDTAITNERVKHSSVGIELTQRTEFFWRVEKALYTTTTKADGSWEIKAEPGSYNIVAQKDGHGWRVLYEQTNSATSNISLPVPVTLKGSYFEDLAIPANSFVVIEGRVTFNLVALSVGPGSIVEFRNNGKLDINGSMQIKGTAGQEILMMPQDTSLTAEVFVHEASNAEIEYVIARYIKSGFYIKNTVNLAVNNTEVSFVKTALEFFACENVTLANNIISNATLGLNISSSKATIQKNILVEIKTNGIEYFDNPGSIVTKNIFKRCEINGIVFNYGGLRIKRSHFNVIFNDFRANGTHLFLGDKALGVANNNNFYNSVEYDISSMSRYAKDTLDFKNNYWGTTSSVEIRQKILDASDFDPGKYTYPLVEFIPFSTDRIDW